MTTKTLLIRIALTLAIGMALTLPFYFYHLDSTLQSPFYSSVTGWHLKDVQPYKAIYDYGTWPAVGMAILGLLTYLYSVIKKRLPNLRQTALYLALVMVIGPALLVNVVFKDCYGRPRPRSIIQYGGTMTYRYPWQPGEFGNGHSFPSGHASMGFYFICLWWPLKKNHRWLARAFAALGVVAGLALGYTRVVQGGHFPSDIIWSAIFIILVSQVTAFYTKPELVFSRLKALNTSFAHQIAQGMISCYTSLFSLVKYGI